MTHLGLVSLVILAAAVGAAGGYWSAPWQATMSARSPSPVSAVAAEDRAILYYRDPSGAPFWSAEPKKDAQGRDYLPVYDDEEASLAPQPKKAQAKGGERKLLYYRNPMGLLDTSPVPKKDSMGMDYVATYEGDDAEDGNTIKVSLDRIQRSGVRSEKVRLRTVVRPIRAPAIVRINERKLVVVTLRAEGYIEELHANATGETVKVGESLFRLYSPTFVQAQLEYALAVKAARTIHDANQMAMIDGASQRLRSLAIPEARIREIQESGTVPRTIEWPAPSSGTVLEKKVVSGQRVRYHPRKEGG